MSGWLYRVVVAVGRGLGLWFVAGFAWFVASGYFLLRPARVANSLEFYRALFPESGRLRRLGLVWRQFHRFAALFAERLALRRDPAGVTIETEGLEQLAELQRSGGGAVWLMSHLGNWELAALKLRHAGAELLLFMGEREREQVEQLQKSDLADSGVRLSLARPGEADAFGALEGLAVLRRGGLVSFAGDRLWGPQQRALAVRFLGRSARLPAGPHLFALASGAPLIAFFAVRLGRRRYRLVLLRPRRVEAASRAERQAAVQDSAQAYADELAEMARRYPDQWFHFERFLEDAGN